MGVGVGGIQRRVPPGHGVDGGRSSGGGTSEWEATSYHGANVALKRNSFSGSRPPETHLPPHRPQHWVTVRKPKELVSASVSVIAVAKKETVRTPKDPDRSLGFGTREHG